MTPPLNNAFRLGPKCHGLRGCFLPVMLVLTALGAPESNSPAIIQKVKQSTKEMPTLAIPEPLPPSTPREFFNAGTRQLNAGKLREAEASLETALASQDQRLQPPALYNLGIVRFGQGAEELKKGPAAKPTLARGQSAIQQGDEALRQAEGALASDDVLKMVAAYMRGRGARKELKG